MELVYLSDVHDAFDRVRELLSRTGADVYIIAGDLIDRPFYTKEMSARYRKRQASFSALRHRLGDGEMDVEDFVSALLERAGVPDDVRRQAEEFREETIRGRRVMQQKYKILESILRLKTGARVLCLPGNYDMDLQYTSLHERDLHRHWIQAGELRIAGYGGADIVTPGIPEQYAVKYLADRGASEMVRFFGEARPDIVATHKPAHGVLDHLPSRGESGSPELRRYCEEKGALLCLTGHLHDQWGFEDIDGTVYLNPSNFGEIHEPGGRISEGGFFYTVETANRRLDRITLRKLTRHGVCDIAVFEPGGAGWTRTVLDRDRYGALLRGKPVDREGRGEDNREPRNRLNALMAQFFPGPGREADTGSLQEHVASCCGRIGTRLGMDAGVDLFSRGVSDGPGSPPHLDLVVYLHRGDSPEREKGGGGAGPWLEEALEALRPDLETFPGAVVVDGIDLEQVHRSIRARDYECDALQRFAAYRSVGRQLAPGSVPAVEGLLDSDRTFRGEIEGTGGTYMEIFLNIAAAVRTMKEFDAGLKELGIVAPEAYRKKIEGGLHGHRKR
ncbi:MAG: metallophosphoesterase [Syntrophales bacterium]